MKNRAGALLLLFLGIVLAQFTLLLPIWVRPFRHKIVSEEFCFISGGIGFLILLILFVSSFRSGASDKLLIRITFVLLSALLLFEIWYVWYLKKTVEEQIEQTMREFEIEAARIDSIQRIDSAPNNLKENEELDYAY